MRQADRQATAYGAVIKSHNSGSIDQFDSAAERYNRVLAAASTHPLAAFVEAHDKLDDQLNGDISLSEAFAAIEHLVEEAKAFKAIVDQFDQASSNK